MSSVTNTSTSNTISGGIKWTGMSSGIDFQSVVDQLVAIEERVITKQQLWKSQWQEKLTSINNLDARLTTLKLNAQDYNTRDKLLTRAATSTQEGVATITNTSTASTGVYNITVGEDIQEKIGSKSYNSTIGVGGGAKRDASGNYLDASGKVIGTDNFGDANILQYVASKTAETSVTLSGDDYIGANGAIVAHIDRATMTITKASDNAEIAAGIFFNAAGQAVTSGDFNGADIRDYVTSQTGQISQVTLSGDDYIGDNGAPVAHIDRATMTITKASNGDEIAAGVVVRKTSGTDTNTVIGAAVVDPDDQYYPPLTITMGGKTLSVAYDDAGSLETSGAFDSSLISDATVVYHKDMTMEQLARVINNAVAADPTNSPNIKADVLYDKNRTVSGVKTDFSRLTITGGEGGVKNHITISDPTALSLDKNSIDPAVVNSQIWQSNATPSVTADSQYTGLVNKTITVVVTNYTEKSAGILGTNDVEFSWADTEGNKGTFIVRAGDWDQDNDCLKNPVELLQGVKITLAGGTGDNRMRINNAFTIDCQAPVMQKAADSGMSQTDKWVHQGVGDLITPVSSGSGKFDYSYAGKNYSVTLNGDLSLSALVEKINTDAKNPGVVASVLNDGMGTSTSYKLVLSGSKVGAEYGIRILDTTSLSNMPTGASTWQHAREASNSMCRIDGYPDDGVSWIQRTGNEVGDVIDGVVVTLEGPGDTQITVKDDVAAMVKKIEQLVESVNFCKDYIKTQTKYGGGKLVSKVLKDGTFQRTTEGGETSGVMIGNYGFQISQSNIDRLMTKEIFTRDEYLKALDPPDGDKYRDLPDTVEDEERDGPSKQGMYQAYLDKHGIIYTRLSDIGIASNPENSGQYIIEKSKLTEALTKNPEAVMKLFTFTPPTSEAMPPARPYADEEPRPSISGFCVTLGYAMSDLTRTTDVIDSKTGEVVKPAKGITKVLADNYNGIISGHDGKGGIDAKIAREEKRIAQYRERLEQKFARLETLLSTLNNQSESLESQLAKLNGD